jgi:hypothetical protein
MPNIRIRAFIGAAAAAVLFAIIASCGGGGGGGDPAPAPTPTPTPIIIRSAVLAGGLEVPPVATSATGSGAVIVTRSTRAITGGVHFAGLTPTAAHIHQGATGVDGGIIITLVISPDGTATVPPNSVLSEAQLAALEAGNLYFNVHTTANPDGEIRGQLITPPATLRAGTATLTGAQQVPPVTTAATGQGTLVFDSSNGLIYTSYVTHNVGMTTNGAHIHQGATGMNGNIQVNFTPGPTLATAPAGSILSPQNRTDFGNGALYFNVHSNAFPDGEIRGQISVVQ